MKKGTNKLPNAAELRRPAKERRKRQKTEVRGRKSGREERALRVSEAKYRILFEGSRDAIMTIEPPSWRFTSGNPAAIEMFKARDEAEFVSCDPWKLSPARQADGRASDEKANAMIEKAVREGAHFFEWIHKRISGEEFPATVLLSRLEQDKKVFLQATVRDITNYKQAEEALHLFKNLVEHSSDAIGMSTHDGRHYYQNEAFKRLFGDVGDYPPETLYVDHAIGKQVFRTIMGGGSWQGEVQMFKKDRTILDILLRAYAIQNQDGHIIGLVGLHTDITARKQAEDEVRKLNESLEQHVQERTAELARANQELETLIRIASHDLRSPLVNIQGFNQLLNKACDAIVRILTDAVLPDETRQALVVSHEKALKSMRFINAGVEKMNGLINGLLHLSRLGRTPLTIRLLDMNALLQSVLEVMAFQIRTAAAEVTVDALPACRADAVLINQVFSNLLDNAIKYRDSARPLRVRVWGRHPGGGRHPGWGRHSGWGRHPGWGRHSGGGCQEEDARVVYCVEDNGLGVAPEDQQKIWDLFYRISPQGSVAGDGIGLPAVQRIVERNGGKVWMESEIGKGSRFFLDLPAAAKEMEP